jgi:hypothetical protein
MDEFATAYPIVWFLGGTLGIGLLCGAIPLVVGARTKQVSLGLYAFFACLLGGFIAGALFAVPIALAFTVALVLKSKKRPNQVVTGSTTAPLTLGSTSTLGVRVLRHTYFVLCIVALTTALAAPIVMFGSIFLLDTGITPITGLLFTAAWFYPVAAVAGGVLGIKSWRKHDLKAQGKWTALAFSGIVALLTGWWALYFFCEGQFACQ